MWKFLRAVRKRVTARYRVMKWAKVGPVPKSLYGLLRSGWRTKSRSLHRLEYEGVCELIRSIHRFPFHGIRLSSELIEHDVKFSADGGATYYRRYHWIIEFQGGGLLVTIYVNSTIWKKCEVPLLQDIKPEDIDDSLVIWKEK